MAFTPERGVLVCSLTLCYSAVFLLQLYFVVLWFLAFTLKKCIELFNLHFYSLNTWQLMYFEVDLFMISFKKPYFYRSTPQFFV